jgi:hypothetical protein
MAVITPVAVPVYELKRGDALPLTPIELAIAELVGTARERWHQEHNTHRDPISDELSSLDYNIGGVAGEMACAKPLNLWPDFRIDCGGAIADLTLHAGATIDVKWNRKGQDLLVPADKADGKRCTLYLLVCGLTPDAFRFGGWTTGDIVFGQDPVRLKGWSYKVGALRLRRRLIVQAGKWSGE